MSRLFCTISKRGMQENPERATLADGDLALSFEDEFGNDGEAVYGQALDLPGQSDRDAEIFLG